MPCDHQLIEQHVVALLENTLPPALAARCESVLAECAHCRETHAQALALQQMARDWQEEPAPAWNRLRHLARPVQRAQPAWLAWTALAASLFTVMLVVSRAEVSLQDGLLIRFNTAATANEAPLQTLLDRYQAEQQAALDERFDSFAAQQRDATELLLARWQEINRAERRQEMDYLLTGWQNQRFQDQQNVNTQLSQLANEQIENNQYLNALLQSVATPNAVRRGL